MQNVDSKFYSHPWIWDQGPYSEYFIFLVTFEWAQQARVFVPNKPFQPSVMEDTLWGPFLSYEEKVVLWIQPQGHIQNSLFTL